MSDHFDRCVALDKEVRKYLSEQDALLDYDLTGIVDDIIAEMGGPVSIDELGEEQFQNILEANHYYDHHRCGFDAKERDD